MKAPNLKLPKTRLAFPLSIFILAAIFFVAYYLYYIPVNKENLHKNGFIILENIKQSVQDRNESIKMMCKGYFGPAAKTRKMPTNVKSFQKVFDENNVTGKVFNFNNASSTVKLVFLSKYSTIGIADNDVILASIVNENVIYKSTYVNTDSLALAIPFESIVQPILQPQKTELFESYLVTDKNGIIYKDPEVSIGEAIFSDTLFANNRASALATIKDINIGGIPHKMFLYPLRLGNDQIVVCGLIKTKVYNTRLSEIPVSFIYPIVISFLLLVIFLPLIKFYIMGPDEHVKFHDISLGSLSFFVGAPLITLTLIQVLMLLSADIRAKENLGKLSIQIDSSICNGLRSAYRQLNGLDSLIIHHPDSADNLQKLKNAGNVDVSSAVKKYYLQSIKDTGAYYNFDRLACIDGSGQQRIKGQIAGEDMFLDVAERNYFKAIKNKEGYAVPGLPGATFAFEPLNNWVNGDFRIVVSKESQLPGKYVVSLSIQMQGITGAILPPGYGFCIVNNSGEVQIHSEANRNLRENILEKISPSRQIKEAINSRQENYFNELRFYGKTNALYIQPIARIPFHLITFYNKGYVVPINMRVFTFALLFCFFTFLICLLIWIVVFRNRYYSYPMLYSPMVFLKWLIPRPALASFYMLGAGLLVAYLLLFGAFVVLAGHFHLGDYEVLLLVLIFPVTVISGVYILSYSAAMHENDASSQEKNKKRALTALGVHLLVSVLAFWYSYKQGYVASYSFIVFQALTTFTMWLSYVSAKKLLPDLSKSKAHYESHFSLLASLLLICVAVLPAGLYTWYAHNQEIIQLIKKEQLYLAESLQKRKAATNKLIAARDTINPSAEYYKDMIYHSGIYKIYEDVIIEKADPPAKIQKKDSYEKFYFSIANDIGNNYYDPLLLPALQDSIKDNGWYWCRSDSTLSFWYDLEPEDYPLTGDSTKNKSLKILSQYPERYKFINPGFRGIILVLFVAALLAGLYRLLLSLTRRVFLKKYIAIAAKTPKDEDKILALFNKYNYINNAGDDQKMSEGKALQEEHAVYQPGGKEADIHDKEKAMIDTVEKLKGFYEFVWQKCSDKEKYLLLDFAHDGLANYKHTAVIYNLLKRGILIALDDDIKLFSASFRAYLLTKKNSPEIDKLQKSFRQNSNFQSFRQPLLIASLGVALFIFFTQEQTFQKILAVVAGLSTVSSLVVKFFVDGSGADNAKK